MHRLLRRQPDGPGMYQRRGERGAEPDVAKPPAQPLPPRRGAVPTAAEGGGAT